MKTYGSKETEQLQPNKLLNQYHSIEILGASCIPKLNIKHKSTKHQATYCRNGAPNLKEKDEDQILKMKESITSWLKTSSVYL
jgi:hypothetical protein